MFKFLNSKLYNQYYPIKTETDKRQFLSNNIDTVRLIIKKVCIDIKCGRFERNNYYINKMKLLAKSQTMCLLFVILWGCFVEFSICGGDCFIWIANM